MIALALELLGAAFAERLTISLVRFVAIAAIKLSVTNTRPPYASFVVASERMLSAWNSRTELNRFIRLIEAVWQAVTAPSQRYASTIITFEFMRRTRTVRLVSSVGAVVIAVADILIFHAQILIWTLEFGARLARDVAIVFVTEIWTIVLAVAALDAGYAATVRAPELRFRTISHGAIRLVAFVHTIEMVVTIPAARDAFSVAASVSGESGE